MNDARIRGNSLHTIAGQASVSALQILQFLVVARCLGPREFGLVASVTAITGGRHRVRATRPHARSAPPRNRQTPTVRRNP